MRNAAFKTFITGYVLVIGIALIVLLGTEKGAVVLWLNKQHNGGLDLFMRFYTYFGYAIWYPILIVALLFYRKKYAVALAAIGLLTMLVFNFFRHFVFTGMPRPIAYFSELQDLSLVDGVDVYLHHSFPSGHSTTAFALALFISLINRSSWIGLLMLVMAVLVAVSRMYLALHFLEDVIVGSLFGILITLGGYAAVSSYHKFWHNPKWNKPLSLF